MNDFYLKFTSQEQAETALSDIDNLALDVIGEIYTTQTPVQNGTQTITIEHEATETEEAWVEEVIEPTYERFEPVKLQGWHVNIRANQLPAELEEFRIYPENPVRVWL